MHFRIIVLPLLIIFSACQSTVSIRTIDIVGSTENALDNTSILVAAYAYKPQTRRSFEDAMVKALMKEGLAAKQSYLLLPNLKQLNAQNLGTYLAANPKNAVLFSHASAFHKTHKASLRDTSELSGIQLFDTARGDWDTEFTMKILTSLFLSGASQQTWHSVHEVSVQGTDPVSAIVEKIIADLL